MLTTDDVPGDESRISVQYQQLPNDVAVGNRIYLQDGQITLRITGKTATEIETTVEFGGELRSTQGINYPDGTLNIPSITDRDFEMLAFGLEQRVDYVAASFVRSAEDIRRVKAFMHDRAHDVPVIAKIEKHEALEDLDNIIDAADGIMVARGDLGMRFRSSKCRSCKKRSSPSVTARASRSSPQRRCLSR